MRQKLFRRGFAASIFMIILMIGCELTNIAPTIQIIVEEDEPVTNSVQTFIALVEDPDENAVVTVKWSVTAGELDHSKGLDVIWTAPDSVQTVIVRAVADDGIRNGIDSTQVTLNVVNSAPRIESFTSSSSYVRQGSTIELTAVVVEPDSEEVEYRFLSQDGYGTFTHADPSSNTATWEAPKATGPTGVSFSRRYGLVVLVTDEQQYIASDTLDILVYSDYGSVWIVDSGLRQVGKYTDRGDLVFKSGYDFDTPVAVASNIEEDFGCYVADKGAGEIVRLGPDGGLIESFGDLPHVNDLAIHIGTSTLWALTQADSALVVYDIFDLAIERARITGFEKPEHISINQSSNEVWISDIGSNSVILINARETMPTSVAAPGANVVIFKDDGGEQIFNQPKGMSTLNNDESTVYVAELGGGDGEGAIERLTYNNASQSFIRGTPVGGTINDGLSHPRQVLANLDNEVWIMNSDGIIEYFLETNPTGPRSRIVSAYTFINPNSMVGDPINGNVWIGDNSTGQVVMIIRPDSLGHTIDGFEFISDMVINK
ncbi:hypothetical protein ACFL6E_02745 [Candidatus Neomarinimicrobiota bacterium]